MMLKWQRVSYVLHAERFSSLFVCLFVIPALGTLGEGFVRRNLLVLHPLCYPCPFFFFFF